MTAVQRIAGARPSITVTDGGQMKASRIAIGIMLLGLAACSAPAHAATKRIHTDQASPSPSAPAPELPPSILARIPKFATPPAPAPITVPPGDSAGWYSAIPTTQPVAFITIDDGWTRVPQGPALLRAAHVPVTLFLEVNAIKADPDYFRQLQQAGAVIEAHTISHRNLNGASYAVQKHEICGSADQLGQLYGRRPLLFRPPFGDKDATTLRVVHDCGMHAAFFWKETTDKGIVRYQTSAHRVQAGDIILMHFRPAFVDDFLAVLAAISQAGLTPALLEDYVK
jgi:peptidoglycan/xylan/chitin deacetylase (PgdA/CDA1 family)